MTPNRLRSGRALATLAVAFVLAGCTDSPPPAEDASRGAEHFRSEPAAIPHETAGVDEADQHPYVGMWITEDGHVRQELLPDGRYEAAWGERESAYTGQYVVTGHHIGYVDDTGFTADGDFIDSETLHLGGMVLTRERTG